MISDHPCVTQTQFLDVESREVVEKDAWKESFLHTQVDYSCAPPWLAQKMLLLLRNPFPS